MDSVWLHGRMVVNLLVMLVVVAPWVVENFFKDMISSGGWPPAIFLKVLEASNFCKNHFFWLVPMIGLALWLDGQVQRFLEKWQMARYWNYGVVVGLGLAIGVVAYGLAAPGMEIYRRML